MACKKVFISSTTSDLQEYRRKAARVIHRLNDEFSGRFQLVERTMDNQGQSGERRTAVEVSTRYVKDSDWVILIVAWNYGFVPSGGEMSVTEWEYRFAREKCDPKKPCFVFIAGEDADARSPYECKDKNQEVDLHAWREFDGTRDESRQRWSENQQKLKKFKEELRLGRNKEGFEFELFTDMKDFLDRLHRTLKQRIEAELTETAIKDIAKDRDLLILLLEQRTHIERCIEEMEMLARLKRVHDHLHKIRQHGISRWRKEILNLWKNGQLDGEPKEIYLETRGDILSERALIDLGRDLHPVHDGQLADELQYVLVFELQTRQSIAAMNREEFEQEVDFFAGLAQKAFTAANAAMKGQLDELRDGYDLLLRGLSNARRDHSLSSEQDRVLNERLDALDSQFHGLRDVLDRHGRWQDFHDKCYELDLQQEGTRLKDLKFSWDTYQRKLCQLLKDAQAEPFAIKADLLNDGANSIRAFFSGKWDASKEISDSYASMREAFDRLFFELDTQTLTYVNHCEERVEHYKTLLGKIKDEAQKHFASCPG